MKKLVSIITVFILLFSFVTIVPETSQTVGAKKIVKYVTTNKTYKIKGTTVLKFTFKRPVLLGKSKAVKSINSYLLKVQKKNMNNALNSGKEAYKSDGSNLYQYAVVKGAISLKYSKDKYSFKETTYTYFAKAAHGEEKTFGYNFNKSTGKKIGISKLTKYSNKVLKNKIVNASVKYVRNNSDKMFSNAEDTVRSYKFSDYNCYLFGSYLYVHYSAYCLASYMAYPGGVTVKVKL